MAPSIANPSRLGIRLLLPARLTIPPIVPNLLLINADVADRERTSSIMGQLPGHLIIAEDYHTALSLLSGNLIDLIVCDNNVIAQGQHVDDAIARFHRLPGRHDVPVLFTCALQRSDVSLKTHRWGVAYHVHRMIAPQVLLELIQTSLTLKVRSVLGGREDGQESERRKNESKHPPIPSGVPKPFGLTLPEVIMPSEKFGISL